MAYGPLSKLEPFGPKQPPSLIDSEQAPPYPTDCFPHILRTGVLSIAAKTQCDEAMSAQSVLGVASFIAQPHVNVETLGAPAPASEFLLTIAESGDRKSTADKHALAPVREHQAERLRQYQMEKSAWQNAVVIWESERTRIINASKKPSKDKADAVDLQPELDDLGPCPEPPIVPILITAEPNYEGLVKLFRLGPGYVALMSSEGGQFLHGYAMNHENRLKTASALSLLWDGDEITRVRGGDELIALHNRRIATHLMAQYAIVRDFFGDEVLREQGLMSRFLTARPRSLMGQRRHRAATPAEEAAYKQYAAEILRLVAIQPRLVAETRNELDPRLLTLSPEAQQLLVAFHDEVELQLGLDGAYRSISGFAAKAAEHAARLAAIFAFVEDQSQSAIPAETMANAISLIKWYLNETLRILGEMRVPEDVADAELIRDWLENGWSENHVGVPDIQRRGPNRLRRDRKRLDAAMSVLVENGNLIRVAEAVAVGGQKRKEAFRINRAAP